jgi:hypothetical protein
LILGDALLHMPHLGEAAKLYSVEITQGDKPMNENVSVPSNLWEAFTAFLLKKQETVEVIKEVIPEDYAAAKQERDEFKTKIETQEREAARKMLVDKYEGELKETKADPSLADLFADMPEEKAGMLIRQLKALSEQIKETNLTEEKGKESAGSPDADPKAEFNTVVLSIAKDKGIPYTAAFEVVKVTHADLFKAAFAK